MGNIIIYIMYRLCIIIIIIIIITILTIITVHRNGGTIKSTRRLTRRTHHAHPRGGVRGRLISEYRIILFTFPDSSWSVVNNTLLFK